MKVKDIYQNQEYLDKNPTWHEEDSEWKAEQIKKIINKNNLNFKSITEIGCGVGKILVELQKSFIDVNFKGYDVSSDVIEMAQKYKTEKISFFNQDLLETKEHSDILLIIDVIEHVENYIDFVRQCKDKATYKIFHIPLDMSVQKLLRPNTIMYNRYHTGHLHYFTRETALATIRDCGYEIIDSNHTRWGIETPQPSMLKKIGKIPLYMLDLISTDLAAKVLGGNSLIVLAK